MELKQERNLEWIINLNKIHSIVNKHLIDKYLYLKVLQDPPKLRILEMNPDSTYKIVSDVVLEIEKEYICYKVLGRYLQIHFKVLNKDAVKGTYTIKINTIGISLTEREDLRIPIKDNQVYLTNFLTSKHIIEKNTTIIPTTIKIGFSEFEKKIKQDYDNVKIDAFHDSDILIQLVKKTEKTIFIEDSYDLKSFDVQHEEILNLKNIFKDNLNNIIQRFRKNQIKSEIISPLYYLSHDHNYFVIGYIQIQSKSKLLNWSDIEKIKQLNKELIDRMLQINTAKIEEKEDIINISRKGFRAVIKNLNLVNYLIKQSGFSCDIVFKGHPPISVFAEIRSSIRDSKGILYIGTKIMDFKSDEHKKNYQQLIDVYEKKYKIMQIQ